MCTASWSVGSGRAVLVFNRDERKDRPRARHPRILERNGIKRLAAIDPLAEGTWLAVNELGLCAFVLNNYEAISSNSNLNLEKVMSRGELPLLATDFGSLADVRKCVSNLELLRFRAFHLGVLDGDETLVWTWDGNILQENSDRNKTILTSSSFNSQEVQTYRMNRYEETIDRAISASQENRRTFHVELNHENAAYNPLMLRDDSETHNVSTIEISGNNVKYVFEDRVSGSNNLLPPTVCILKRR